MRPGCPDVEVTNEILPLELEAIIVCQVVRYLFPLIEEVHALRDVRIPDRARSIHSVLREAARQTCNGGAVSAIALKGQEIIPPHPRRPRRIDMSHNSP